MKIDNQKVITLTKKDMSDSCVNINIGGFSTVDHQTIHKLHALGTLASKFARNNNLTALGSRLHDETENTIAGSGTTIKIRIYTSGLILKKNTFGQPSHQ